MLDNNERKKAHRKYIKGKMTFLKWINTIHKEGYYFNDENNQAVENGNQSNQLLEVNYQFISGSKRILKDYSNEPKRALLGVLIALSHGIQSGVNNFSGVKSAAKEAFRHYIDANTNHPLSSSEFEIGRVHVSSRCPFSIIPVLKRVSKGNENCQQNEEQRSPRQQEGISLSVTPKNVVYNLNLPQITSQGPQVEEETIGVTFNYEKDLFCPKGAFVVKEATSTSNNYYIFQLVLKNTEFSVSQSPEKFLLAILSACDDAPLVISSPTITTSDEMLSYHPVAVPKVPGLYVVSDFITMQEEDIILAELERIEQEKEDQRKHISGDKEGDVVDTTGGKSLATSGDRVTELTTWEIMARRDCWHFNRRFYYELNSVGGKDEQVSAENPEFFIWLMERMRNGGSSEGNDPMWPVPTDYMCDQLTINRYRYDHLLDDTDDEKRKLM